MRENQLSARKTVLTRLTFGKQRTKNIVRIRSSRVERILRRERVATRFGEPRFLVLSRLESRHARALKYVPHVIGTIFFVRCIPKVSRASAVLRAESWFSTHLNFYCINAGKFLGSKNNQFCNVISIFSVFSSKYINPNLLLHRY